MRVSFTTLGCKVNQYETQALETLLRRRGHAVCAPGQAADAHIINTCAVTGESARKSRQAIRRARRADPEAVIAVCGCFSQISPAEIEDLGADLVYGSGEKAAFLDDLERVAQKRARVKKIENPMTRRRFEPLPAGGLGSRTRAMLKIQDGCDNFCAYCIIPYARGPVRSLPPELAVREAEGLVQAGYREIVLTGIEISSYGKELGNDADLITLTERICGVTDGGRIRLGSLEPRTVTEDFCVRAARLPRLCRGFHLSLQSGCDETLKRMGRRYDTGRFLESVRLLRRHMPDCAVTTDLIVGFPGESEAEFEQTLAFVEACRFADMHIFPYSVRPGTRAAQMDGQADVGTKAARAGRAAGLAGRLRGDYLQGCVGTLQEVLFEREKDGRAQGHSGNGCLVSVPGTDLRNRLRQVRVTGVSNEILTGALDASV